VAGVGPPPKAEGQRVRRHKGPAGTVLPAGGFQGSAPAMPAFYKRGGRWHPKTLAWWQAMASWPQAATWLPSDWDHLADTAILKDQLHRDPVNARQYLPEIRLRMAALGSTVADRQRLRMSLGDPEVGAGAPDRAAAGPASRRRLKAVDGG